MVSCLVVLRFTASLVVYVRVYFGLLVCCLLVLVVLNIIVLLVDLYDFYLNSCIFDYCFRFWLLYFVLGQWMGLGLLL